MLLNCFFLLAFLIIIVIYLIQVNTAVSYSLEMKHNNMKLEELQAQNEYLVRAVTDLSAIGNIYSSSHNLNLVKAKNVEYVIPAQETLAGGY